MKKAITILLLILVSVLMTGCASDSTPLDYVWPTAVPPMAEDLTGIDCPSVQILGIDVTTTGVLHGYKKRIELESMKFGLATKSINWTLESAAATREGVLGLLAAIGLGGIPIAHRMQPPKKKEKA